MTTSSPATGGSSLERAHRLFVGFLVASGGLFLLWEALSPLYLQAITSLVNVLFGVVGEPARFAVRDGALVAVLEVFGPSPLSLQLGGNDIFYLNLVVGGALFLATPGADLGWRLRWLGVVFVVTAATHVVSLWIGPDLVFQDFLRGLAPHDRARLLELGGPVWRRRAEPGWGVELFAGWRHFGRLGLEVALWFYAARDYLRLSR